MRKRQGGQALILVLILLAIGALLIVPSLMLTSNALSNNQIYLREVKAMYAADAAQEWILWKLTYDGLGAEFTYDGQTANYQIEVCGIPVDVTVVMRAMEGEGGVTLATDDTIKPTKTVIPSSSPTSPLPDGSYRTYTYTIRLEQLSTDNSVGLDAVYDVLPKGFGPSTTYIPGSSKLRVDGGSWESFSDPAIEDSDYGGQIRLKWPSTYDPATGTGGFSSPMRDFEVRQVKEIQFQVSGSLTDNNVHANWVVLKPWDTLSGPQAGISVGTTPDPWYYYADGLLEVDKVSDPELIQPGVEYDITYTISVTNRDGATRQLQGITDYLPQGFTYNAGTASGITTSDPQLSLENLNGVDRWVLRWTTAEFPNGNAVSIAKGETVALTFQARTTKDVSGSYYNEVQIKPNVPVPKIVYEIIGPTTDEDPEDREAWNTTYSWNTGGVLVPFYDGRTDADQVIIDSNIALILGGVAVNSWQVR